MGARAALRVSRPGDGARGRRDRGLRRNLGIGRYRTLRTHSSPPALSLVRSASSITSASSPGRFSLTASITAASSTSGSTSSAVAAVLDHADPGVTLRVYSHLWPSDEDRTRDAIDAALGAPVSGPGAVQRGYRTLETLTGQRSGGESACTPDSVPALAEPRWRPSLSAGGCPPAPAAYPGVSAGGPPSPCLALLPVGFAEPPGSPRALVRSYRTVSPLPVRAGLRSVPPSAVCSLWHFPAGRPDWVLPSTVPCGVRTFLGPVVRSARHAAARPTRHHHHCRTRRRQVASLTFVARVRSCAGRSLP